MVKNFLAVIPARGGSKRLPRKNILPLAGKPLIVWTIEAALNCKLIDTILVSSDDDDILNIAAKYGVSSLKRPSELAQDISSGFDVIKHAVENSDEHKYVIMLQPTSPLRTSQHINEAIELLHVKSADAVISVTQAEHSPLWANTLPEDKSMRSFLHEDIKNKRSQDLPVYYRLNGAIYIINVTKLLKEKTFFIENNIYAYIMENEKSIDIDTKLDFRLCELLISYYEPPLSG